MTTQPPRLGIGTSVPLSRLALVALVGDVAVIAAFPLLGESNHAWELDGERFVRAFAPFAVAWLALGSIATAYADATLRKARRMLVVVPPAWVVAGALAMAIRVVVFDRAFSLSFAIVAISLMGAMLLAWRLALAIGYRAAKAR